MLLRAGASINQRDKYGWTALMDASNWGNVTAVRALLAFPGVLVNLTDASGSNALVRASKRAHTNVVVALLDAGAVLPLSCEAPDGEDPADTSASSQLLQTESIPRMSGEAVGALSAIVDLCGTFAAVRAAGDVRRTVSMLDPQVETHAELIRVLTT
jgi:ankyrin repeat protein